MGISNTVQQLSVFLENREGRLDEVLEALAQGRREHCGPESCRHVRIRHAPQ